MMDIEAIKDDFDVHHLLYPSAFQSAASEPCSCSVWRCRLQVLVRSFILNRDGEGDKEPMRRRLRTENRMTKGSRERHFARLLLDRRSATSKDMNDAQASLKQKSMESARE